jgi:hypothetical protein
VEASALGASMPERAEDFVAAPAAILSLPHMHPMSSLYSLPTPRLGEGNQAQRKSSRRSRSKSKIDHLEGSHRQDRGRI